MSDWAALVLQLQWGADEALGDACASLLQVPPPAETPLGPRVQPSVPPPRTAAGPSAVQAAEDAAAGAATLEALRAAIEAFAQCPLRQTATRLVFAEGDPASGLVLVTDAPTADDDRAGRPASGAQGEFLDRVLASIGLQRARLLITPIVPWRPPGGRPPTDAEIAQCRPFLLRLLVLANARRLVVFGSPAAKALGVAPASGRGRPFAEMSAPGLASIPVHCLPAIARLRAEPKMRRIGWSDLRVLRHALDAG